VKTEIRADTLDVDGATLYYEVRGGGPPLLMIPGGGGDAGYYTAVADILADQFTVITYDRRGNSRSTLTGGERDMVIAEQSQDARSLLDALDAGPAYVFGNSSGAIIGLDLAARHPEALVAVIAHEPPIVKVLPDAAEQLAFFDEVCATYRRQGWYPAWEKFAATIGGEEGAPKDPALFERMGGNLEFMLSREMRPAVNFEPDVRRIKENGTRVILAGGRASRPYYYCRPAPILAEQLEAEFVEFPGHHNAYLDDPPGFAETLRSVLLRLRDEQQ
jgi:pimeloyl-ACP methyl ester carboxylesterase